MANASSRELVCDNQAVRRIEIERGFRMLVLRVFRLNCVSVV
jgi:hypothetical protein